MLEERTGVMGSLRSVRGPKVRKGWHAHRRIPTNQFRAPENIAEQDHSRLSWSYLQHASITWYTDFDGTTLGAGTERLKLPAFEQEKQIEELDVFPLEYHPNVGEVKRSLLKRGELFHNFCGTHDCEYEAIAIREQLGEYYQAPTQFLKTPVTGRVKIDTKSFNMFNPLFAIEVNHFHSRSTSVNLSGNTYEAKL
ncbi:hypothetical protein BS50DRAFT_268334 [Corynespora cassiicola Philippines]|uniref:DUF7025 domain-containing protein n=1 Tax=Corynespora cassiicola Philippines TaxID=1448308 RepID=A0A2T2NZJ1_CORCC|nr:hypothetical protein BS50DRAFT_268334 [Corynespora cassiicola Philippines]